MTEFILNTSHMARGVGAMPERVAWAHDPKGVNWDGSGKIVTNAGVYEHWNNSEQKQYNHNLGKSGGIELVYIKNFSY